MDEREFRGLVWAAKPGRRLVPPHSVQQPESRVFLRTRTSVPERRAQWGGLRSNSGSPCSALGQEAPPDLGFLFRAMGQLCGVLRKGAGEIWVRPPWDPPLFPSPHLH